jgi:hypothetical protein
MNDKPRGGMFRTRREAATYLILWAAIALLFVALVVLLVFVIVRAL